MSNLENKKTYGLFANPFNNKLITELNQSGEDVLIFPAVRTEKLELTENGTNYLKNLTGFDWIIITDIFAADYFIENLGELEIDFFELDNLMVCTLGEAVADRLRFVQIHADLIPSKINNEVAFSMISQFVNDELDGLRFLVLGEERAKFSLSEQLIAKKAIVKELAVYRAAFVDENSTLKLKTLLKGGAVDEFIFSSPEDLMSLRFLLQENDFSIFLNEVKISATSEIVYQSLQEINLRPLYFHKK